MFQIPAMRRVFCEIHGGNHFLERAPRQYAAENPERPVLKIRADARGRVLHPGRFHNRLGIMGGVFSRHLGALYLIQRAQEGRAVSGIARLFCEHAARGEICFGVARLYLAALDAERLHLNPQRAGHREKGRLGRAVHALKRQREK